MTIVVRLARRIFTHKLMGSPGEWKLKDRKSLGEEELKTILVKARQDSARSLLMILLAYHAALRVSELVHLRIKDFNWESKRLSLIPLKKAGSRKIRLPSGAIRVVSKELPLPVSCPIPQRVVDVAYEYVQAEKLKKDGFLFPGRTTSCFVVGLGCKGGHLSKREVQHIWTSLCEQANVQRRGRGIHSLKHAKLIKVATDTQDARLVKEIGRHASVTMGTQYVEFVLTHNK